MLALVCDRCKDLIPDNKPIGSFVLADPPGVPEPSAYWRVSVSASRDLCRECLRAIFSDGVPELDAAVRSRER
jgi:hypothetical protein